MTLELKANSDLTGKNLPSAVSGSDLSICKHKGLRPIVLGINVLV